MFKHNIYLVHEFLNSGNTSTHRDDILLGQSNENLSLSLSTMIDSSEMEILRKLACKKNVLFLKNILVT